MGDRKHFKLNRVVSIITAASLLVCGLDGYTYKAATQHVKAASVESGMETNELLSLKYIADPEVLRLYIIIANAVKKNDTAAIADISSKSAQEILESDTYKDSEYTGNVEGQFLIEYDGRIDFAGMKIGDISGIGWARGASEIDLSKAVFDKPLTEIPADEFAACRRLEKIVFPETVTKIGNRAFQNDLSLKTLKIGEGADDAVDLTHVSEVGDNAFNGCAAVEHVNLPGFEEGAELKLGAYAFSACAKLKEIVLPIKNADNIGASVFENCSSLESVGLCDELSYLSNGLFKGTGTDTIGGVRFYINGQAANEQATNGQASDEISHLPQNVEYIGNNCFEGAFLKKMDLSGMKKLAVLNEYSFAGTEFFPADESEELILPENLKRIESVSFTGSAIMSLDVPKDCTYIGSSAFEGSLIARVSLPKGIKEIAEKTFKSCGMLDGEHIEIPDDSELTSIGDNAFNGCRNLNTTAFIKNLKKLTSIGDGAFADCYGIEKIENSEQSDMYGNKRIACGLEEVVLPDCVKTLGAGVFSNDYALRTADLGTGVIHIPDSAFADTMSASQSPARLEKVIVSSELESIGDEAFLNQARLHTVGYRDETGIKAEEGTVQFKEGLLTIGNRAFEGCAVRSRFSASGAIAYVPKGEAKTSYEDGLSKFLIYDYNNELSDTNECRIVYIDENNIADINDMENEGDYDSEIGGLTAAGTEKYDKVILVAKEVYVNRAVMRDNPDPMKNELSLETYDIYETSTEEYEGRLYNRTSGMSRLYCDDTDEAKANAITAAPFGDNEPVWINIKSSSRIEGAAVKNVMTTSLTMYYMFGIKDVVIPDTVMNDGLGEAAFRNCINLNKVKLSENLSEIKNDTFSGCAEEVQNSLGGGDELRYYDYIGLRDIEIPNSIKKIGDNAFRENYNLKLKRHGGSSFGTAVESIGNSAFYKCYSLDEIYFPTSLKTIGREAFAECALQENEPVSISYNDSGRSYSYYMNKESYGTKEKKNGLRVIDFTAAASLESVGEGAFRMTNVETVNLTRSHLTDIPDNLFERCVYLRTATLQNDTKSVGANVFKDTVNLITVMIPAGATLKKNTISGAFGSLAGKAEPTINLSQRDEDIDRVIPINGENRLPVNAINEDTINGEVKIMVNTGTAEAPVWQDIIDKTVMGVSAHIEKEDDGRYSFILEGKDYISEAVMVRLEVGTKFRHADAADDYLISTHTMIYRVTVDDVTTEQINVSAADDDTVMYNPAMYEESSQGKVLHIAYNPDASDYKITLKADIEPAETTDEIVWESSDRAIEISDIQYEEGSGSTSAKISAAGIGYADVTVKAVSKKTGLTTASDKIRVYGEIPVAPDGLSAETSGTYLGTNLKPNSKSKPYMLSVGDSDRIIVNADYGDTGYTQDQTASYGEKYIFESSDENVMTVSVDGTFKAVGEGEAKITVTARASGTKIEFWFNVADNNTYYPAAVYVSSDKASLNEDNRLSAVIYVGEQFTLEAQVEPKKASQEVTWMIISGTDIVSVDESGVVTGLKKGKARITAAAKEADSVRSEEVYVEVKAHEQPEATARPTATKKPADTSQDAKKPSPTARKKTEENIPAVSITLLSDKPNTKKMYMSKGESVRIKVKPAPENTTDEFTYKSSKPKAVKVSESGYVTAVKKGKAKITVTATSGKKVSFTVIVLKKPVSAKKVKFKMPKKLKRGKTVRIKPRLVKKKSTDTVSYSIDNPQKATVDVYGYVTALKKGKVRITVTASSGKSASRKIKIK